jgi:uncharacterized membrane protein
MRHRVYPIALPDPRRASAATWARGADLAPHCDVAERCAQRGERISRASLRRGEPRDAEPGATARSVSADVNPPWWIRFLTLGSLQSRQRVSTGVDPSFRARAGRAAQLAYGASAAGLGVLCLLAGDLAYVFQPVPRWMPLRGGLAYVSGAVLIAGGLALLARRTTRLAAGVLAVHFAAWLLLCDVPATVARPGVVGNWEGCGLVMTVIAGGWILFARSGRPAGRAAHLRGDSGVRLARRLYAAGVPLVGLAHFVNAREATVYVPTWLPLQIDWVYLTGAGHIAAGLAILLGIVPRLAAVLEAAQITAFVILAHIPAVYAAPGDRIQWAMLVYAVTIAASAWLATPASTDRVV